MYTDHRALLGLMKNKELSRRQVRWVEKLSDFTFDIQHVAGEKNGGADALSRRADYWDSEMNMLPTEPVDNWPDYAMDALLGKELPRALSDTMAKKVERALSSEKFRLNDDLEMEFETADGWRKYQPWDGRLELITRVHEDLQHLQEATINELRSKYWWPNMRRFVLYVIQQCRDCQLNGRIAGEGQEPLHPLPTVQIFERWHIDSTGRLPMTRRGNQYLLIAVDSLTKWVCMRATPTRTAEDWADFLYGSVFMNFGVPAVIVSDRATEFRGKVISKFMEKLGAEHRLTSAYHPQTNGAAEKVVGIVKGMLTKRVRGAVYRWDEFVGEALRKLLSSRLRR